MTGPRIAVLGAGANGASVGADLTRAGLDVTLIEQWPDHVEAMRAQGIHIELAGTLETTDVRVRHLCEVAEMVDTFDIVFVMVKAYDTRWACELIKPLLAGDGVVVGVQNGMTYEDIADVVGADRALGSVIEVASTMFEPGIVRRDTSREESWFAIGSPNASAHGRSAEVSQLLAHCGRVEVTSDIIDAKWMKLVANCTELVTSAVLDMTVLEAVTDDDVRAVMVEAGNEAVRACVASGHRLRPIIGMSTEDLGAPEEAAERLLQWVHDKFLVPGQLTTVLQDWKKGRRSEVHELNGHVARVLEQHGGSAPVNTAVLNLATSIELGRVKPSAKNATELVRSLDRERRDS